MSWSKRSTEDEELDDLDFKGPALEKSLDELSWVHKYLGGHFITIRTLKHALKSLKSHSRSPVRILDAGCGGGESLRSMANWAVKNAIDIELNGIDGNPSTIQYARNKSTSYSNITYKTEDIFSHNLEWGRFDIVMFSLILHHFSNEQIKTILGRCAKAGVAVVAINDLHRHPLAYYLFAGLTKLIGFSQISRNDGLLSIKKAFKKPELQQLLRESGYNEFKITWQWAFRYEAIAIHNK